MDRSANSSLAGNINQAGAGSLRVGKTLSFCKTQKPPKSERGAPQLRIGDRETIRRWESGITLTYVVCTETFPTERDAVFVMDKLEEAAQMWGNAGVAFQRVNRNDFASFRVIYDIKVHDPDTLAYAFFPNTDDDASRRTLGIYETVLFGSYREFLVATLAHELGHIQGLHHEFPDDYDNESVQWGEKNSSTIMWNICRPMTRPRVQPSDVDSLRSFYNQLQGGQYREREVEVLTPVEARYGLLGWWGRLRLAVGWGAYA
ncbi:hypothetical protein B0T16DRAFT_325308 [Cercophora newfieldiana]|uniref:Peptidase metallopeptidase domain-containing protein n=1 Tax=Cercophora newfieldiana TaxID=92897 RepID=A0AA40CRE8_9PEZI|nr:hypothetical protein B0T16DRAFT_325308 [Cercophora newfieldiana]